VEEFTTELPAQGYTLPLHVFVLGIEVHGPMSVYTLYTFYIRNVASLTQMISTDPSWRS
jgi:hypothetical protein